MFSSFSYVAFKRGLLKGMMFNKQNPTYENTACICLHLYID